MTNNFQNSSPDPKIQPKKFNFWTLYRKFKFKVIKHFLFSTIGVIFWTINLTIISNLFKQEGKITDYSKLLPEPLQNPLGNLGWGQFVVGGIILVLIYAAISYFDNLWGEELRVKGGHYTKNLLLEKFRRLSFEEKQAKKDEVNNLIEKDSGEIGYDWEHLPNHILHCLLTIITLLYFHWADLTKMGQTEILFALFWLVLINVITYLFTKIVLRNEKKYKKKLDEEWKIINKERSSINLIESMGLSSQYETQQKKISHSNEKLVLGFNRSKSLSKVIPIGLLAEIFPYFLLWFSGNNFIGASVIVFWFVLEKLIEIFRCLWDYADYSSSQERINAFLSLPEKNDNLGGIKLDHWTEIKALHCQNITFSYAEQTKPILKNYTRTFLPGEINHLTGANGAGKSTLLYLLLGMLIPQQGQILIETERGITYNLHQDINLKYWRENQVAYCSHNTLIEEGSTGQKQLANIANILTSKKDAQIFLFDEADNALDKDNQQEFQEKVKNLAKKKLVVYIKH